MSIYILKDYLPVEDLHWIEKCKSGSSTQGGKLRKAHNVLGQHIAKSIHNKAELPNENYAVLVLMRAGLNFGLGISDELEELGADVEIHFITDDILGEETLNAIENKTPILADAVINSGRSILKVYDQLPLQGQATAIVATTVIPLDSVKCLEKFNLMTVRTSENKYKGARVTSINNGVGPDTGDRLFGTLK